METPEQAQAAGEKLREILLRVAMKYDDAMRKLDGSSAREQQAEFIDDIIAFVRETIRPAYAGRDIVLYEKGRSVRSFEFECQRLWNRAITLYLNDPKAVPSDLEKFLNDPAHASLLHELQNDTRRQVETFTIPLLEKYETPGEDLYLHTYHLMIATDEDAAIDLMADSGKTPAELASAFFGMFGLLIQAKRAEQQGDVGRAYSFLLDANHLIGMHEGARYAMAHLPEVAAKRRAKINSAKSRAGTDKARIRACDLFYALRPIGADSKPQLWASANVAMEAVWNALVEEAQSAGKTKPGAAESTILSVCQQLHRLDKDGGSLDIRVEVVRLLPDGTELRIPLD
ncbi:hypothetical protein [Paraburkholderia humisilvae]|uniref:Uncharacterized protein n=1 Tax=Paraburkholderia humisilvae TaxID=627669 RepID=A0A6J5CV89_9BURK|nr:hypothetical protein [Paraburkholderia humisilvae]CAB3746050.1 hypothetical protein LMG29542_00110 [Paraburkholderia humisilvae]